MRDLTEGHPHGVMRRADRKSPTAWKSTRFFVSQK